MSTGLSKPVAKALILATFLVGVQGCLASSHTDDYFVGLTAGQLPPQTRPMEVGLVLVLPETESQKPTALSPESQAAVTGRIENQLRQGAWLHVKKVLPTIILPGDGLKALPLDRLREIGKQAQVQNLMVVVASSQTAQRVQPFPLIETELFARMDLVLVELSTGQVLLKETGAEDYLLGQRRDVAKTISYPRIYYRTQTESGPFLIVEGDPFRELGKVAFEAAGDQLVMRLLERLRTS